MTPPRTVGFSPSETIPSGAKLRVTWGEAFAPNFDGLFSRYFGAIVNRVQPTVTQFAPLAQPTAVPGATSATGDYINHAARTGATIIAKLASLNDNFVELKEVELLTGAKAAAATTPAGAVQRDQKAAGIAAEVASDNPLVKLGAALGTTGKVITIAAVAIVAILLYLEFGGRQR